MCETQALDHLEYIRSLEHPSCVLRYTTSDAGQLTLENEGAKLHFVVASTRGTVFVKSAMVEKMKEHGSVQIDTEPLVRLLRTCRKTRNELTTRRIEFACLHAFQEWLLSNPQIFIHVDDEPRIALCLLTMKSTFT